MNERSVRHVACTAAGVLLLAAGACVNAPGEAGAAAAGTACAQLIELDLPDTTIMRAESTAAGGFTPPGGSAAR